MIVVALACSIQAQTYKVGSNPSANPPVQTGQTPAPSQTLGFGSNIQNARLARAAELALRNGDHALALGYAQRAVQAAPNDPQLWFLVGYAARLNGKFQQAVDAYQHGLRLRPGSVDGLSGLAQTYSVIGRTDQAMALLKQVVAENPRQRDDTLLLGDLSMRSGDYKGALDWLLKAERLQPDARSELLLAISYQHLNQMNMASRYLNLAKQRAPNNPEVQRALAGYYRDTGNYAAAIAALKSIRNPRPDVQAELAYTYQLAGKLDDAARVYAVAANARPRDLGLQLSAAQAEVAAGVLDDAEPFLQRAAGISPDYYRLHAIRGEIAQLQDHDNDAVREYSVALAHLPATPIEGPLYGIQLHVDLMELYNNLHDDNGAHQQLTIAQTQIGALDEQGPDRAPFLRLRALIKMSAGQLDSALSDMKEALTISPNDPNNLQLNGDVLMKLGRTEDAIAVYKKVLAIDPRNRFALTSLGYASRTVGRDAEAEKYFLRLAHAFPTLYVPYLALGDMYTAHHEFKRAEASYRKAYALAPKNALIIAGGMNAAIEAQKLNLAEVWLGRSIGDMQHDPQILKETERYLRLKGDYAQSAAVGEEAIKVLPQDRDVVVYLGYDLLQLGKYDELLQLTTQYSKVFPQDADLPLLAGYVHKHNGQLDLALQDFTEALKRDPKVVTAYVNRGYVLNDLHKPDAAAVDFEAAIQREPKNGQAHLGLAYADLDLGKASAAVRQSQLAEEVMGDSELVHVIRATAYGREGMLSKAVNEYRAALKFSPNDGSLHLGLGNALFAERRYHQAVDELLIAQRLSPDDANVYALLARAYAFLNDRQQTLRYVQLAEQKAQQAPPNAVSPLPGTSEISAIYVATGQALSTLGDQKAAMLRFQKALTAPNSNRITVRLAIAQLMAQQERNDEAQRQIALALMEAEAGRTPPPTGEQFIEAADVFRQMHEYELSQTYLERARAAGAPDITVRVGMANTYLALGDTARAAAELAAVSSVASSQDDYQFLIAQANVYQQEHQGTQAVTAFAQAASAAGEDQTAEQSLLTATGNEGFPINPNLTLLGDFLVQPIFEDTTVYVLDSKLDGPTPVPPSDVSLLPPPRSSIDTQGIAAYHLNFRNFPTAAGFFQISNARGTISVPAINSIVNRDTTQYTANIGLNPTLHLGRNVLTFDSGIQGTLLRDANFPVQLNQNLFRAFTYLSTTSFFNVISVSGYGIYETGPFTETNEHSRAIVGAIDFRVGAPWAKTALVTGWGSNDQLFTPVGIENYYTSSYIGFTRRFSDRLNIEALAEDLRAWRVVGARSGIAQNLRPAGDITFALTRNWNLQGSTAYSDNRSYHVYDATQNSFSIGYVRGFTGKFHGESGETPLKYPIRFSAGFQQESFFNFTSGKNQQFRPYVSITIF